MEASDSNDVGIVTRAQVADVIVNVAADEWKEVCKEEHKAPAHISVQTSKNSKSAILKMDTVSLLDGGAGKTKLETKRQRQRQRQRERRRIARQREFEREKKHWKQYDDIPELAIRYDTSDDESDSDDSISISNSKQRVRFVDCPDVVVKNSLVSCNTSNCCDACVFEKQISHVLNTLFVCLDYQQQQQQQPQHSNSTTSNSNSTTGNSTISTNTSTTSTSTKSTSNTSASPTNTAWPGLNPPRVKSGERVSGINKRQHRRENKAARIQKQEQQQETSYWQQHGGRFNLPENLPPVHDDYKGGMCPSGLATYHPAAETLLQYATGGCPSNTGKPWTKQQIQEAIERGPHVSAMAPDAMAQLKEEVLDKVKQGQARLVEWDSIKDCPPEQLKISPIAMIPHKSRKYRAILDLSFKLRLKNGDLLPSVNEATTLEAPSGAIDQLGHSLQRVIHAFAEAEGDEKVFMAKFDIKDGFWRLNCQEGEEWNFAYVLPTPPGEPVKLVVPNSLQMGWVESPPYFCAASETARDVAMQYIETKVGSLPQHKFESHAMSGEEVKQLPEKSDSKLKYFLDVYVDDYVPMAIATSQEQVRQVARGVLHGIHDIFPADENDDNDPVSMKKLKKGEGTFALQKEILGFDFDGESKTMVLSHDKRVFLLAILHKWVRTFDRGKAGVPFPEFESVIAKTRHAFIAIPAGKGLMTPFNKLLQRRPDIVYFHRNKALQQALLGCQDLIRQSSKEPTPCRELVMGESDYVGVKDASIHGVGGVVVGHNKACVPTVFRMAWPQDIKDEVQKTNDKKGGKLTNSDLECAGLLLLWLVIEAVCDPQPGDHIALFSDNSPTVSWVERMAARGSLVADQLLRALTLRLKVKHVSPLTPMHIEGKKNSLTDVPSRSFGSNLAWYCANDDELLTLFDSMFTLPDQSSWTVFRLSSAISIRVISILRMQVFGMDEWRRLPRLGKHIGSTGKPTANLWEWTLTFREQLSEMAHEHSQDLQQECDVEAVVAAEKSKLTRYRRRSRPLARRSPWPAASTPRS